MIFKGRIANLAIPAVLLLFVSAFLLLGKYLWDYPVSVILFPLVVGTLVILCAVWLIIRSAVTPLETLAAEGESIGESEDPRTGLFKRLLWIASVYPLSYLLGLIAGLMLFTFGYTSYHRLPWSQRLIATAIVFALVYIGFYKLLGVSSLPIAPLWMRN
jgi:hypothetical protein